eukprot:TRINITY_DN423_c0_g1_i4.p1 TRINITY_DN423_c0_g1~~TRINITY_DN423_c0_g1_i4.p1  ORF type:complete len:317 (-),score=46.93 TRINITY_DN423_c0_g1_i4:943-1893(-)
MSKKGLTLTKERSDDANMSEKGLKDSITLSKERSDDASKTRTADATKKIATVDLARKSEGRRLMDSVTEINKVASSKICDDTYEEIFKRLALNKKSNLSSRAGCGVDILYLMDCTGSMGTSITACREKIKEIGEAVRKEHQHCQLRQAFIGYRDYGDSGSLMQLDFVGEDNLKAFQQFMDPIGPTGGGDMPEDIAPALKAATGLSWQSPTKLLIHFADAPCHGKTYYSGTGDNYPAGSPTGIVPETQLKILYQMKIDFFFAQVGNKADTNQMVEVFKSAYENPKKAALFRVLDSFSNPEDFVPLVVGSISDTLTKI